ncbi:MAG: thrombospondin type 3 repeat-containing protein [Polyangiaceae bacterium]
MSPSLDLRGFRASPDPAAGLYYEPVSTPGHLDANAAAWLSYAYGQAVIRMPSGQVLAMPMRHSLTGDFAINVGLFGRASLGLVLPYALYQSGDPSRPTIAALTGDVRVPAQALGDVGLVGKFTLIAPTSGEYGFGLALHERFTFPSGDEASWLGEGDVTSETRLLAEYTTRTLGLYGSTGFKLRGSEERVLCSSEGAGTASDPCLTRAGHEIPFGLSLRFTPRGLGLDPAAKWTAFAEIYGHIPVTPIDAFRENRVATTEVALGARYAFQRDFSALAAVATGVVSGLGEPAFRGVVSLGWAPRTHDADHDGIDDDVDQCRELAEDRDHFEDDDGCPEGDNDQDTVPDTADKCPNEKEDLDGFRDDDGCPDPDNDNDGIVDAEDACPNEAGVEDTNPKRNGCSKSDQDGDGIFDQDDKCVTQAEDRDNFQDDDGCPDPDNDNDGVLDAQDTCPNVPGVPSQDPKQNGCPEIDADGDTFWGAEDKCPLQAEDFNGKDDDDGCPDDPKRKGFVTVSTVKGEPTLSVSKGVTFTKDGAIDPASMSVIRAIGAELTKHPALGTTPAWSVAVGVRTPPKGTQSDAMLRAFTVVDALRRITRRDTIAETVGWSAVKDLPGASAQGIGFLLLTGTSPESAAPEKKPVIVVPKLAPTKRPGPPPKKK